MGQAAQGDGEVGPVGGAGEGHPEAGGEQGDGRPAGAQTVD